MAERDEQRRAKEPGAPDESRRSAQGSPETARNAGAPRDETEQRRESGEPGGGQGRRDQVGGSKVYPMSGTEHPADAELRTEASWGQGERGAAGYEDSGGSELVMRDGELLGGTTAGPSGEPTIDIHGGDAGRAARGQGAGERQAKPGGGEQGANESTNQGARQERGKGTTGGSGKSGR